MAMSLHDKTSKNKTQQPIPNALNPQLSQAFLAVRQAEWEAMKDWKLIEEVTLLLERY